MGFLDSSSSIVTAILTRLGRQKLAQNDGSFKITQFGFADDEINYQLYSNAAENDTDILNLPILEPSSNETTALRYRLVTTARGAIQAAYLTVNPTSMILGPSPYSGVGNYTVQTFAGVDAWYDIQASGIDVPSSVEGVYDEKTGISTGIIPVSVSDLNTARTITFTIIGRSTGATITVTTVISGTLPSAII